MSNRCNNTNASQFRWYGGRGISVCARWDRFENFLSDMGHRPAGTSLDRIDGNGNYEPGNCRWATQTEQMRHTRATRLNTEAVRVIRWAAANGRTHALLARLHGVSRPLVSSIVRGDWWRLDGEKAEVA